MDEKLNEFFTILLKEQEDLASERMERTGSPFREQLPPDLNDFPLIKKENINKENKYRTFDLGDKDGNS